MTPSDSREEEDDDYKGVFSEVVFEKFRTLLDEVHPPKTVRSDTKEFEFPNFFKNQRQLKRRINFLFSNAVNGSEYCAVYADILKNTMESIQIDKERSIFIKIIEQRLKWHFEHGKSSKPRDHSVFMGHLFIRRLISLDALEKCCQRLLESISRDPLQKDKIDEDSVLSGLEMFRIIGPFIDKMAVRAVKFLDDWFQKLEKANKFCKNQTTRCLIINILKLRANMWITISEVKEQNSSETASRRDPAAIQIRAVLAKIRALLYNVTAVNLNELTRQFISYTASFNQQQLAEVIHIFFEKAVNGSKYCSLYADILKNTMESIRNDTARSVFIGIIEHCLMKYFSSSKPAEARIYSIFIGHLFIRHLVSMDCLQTCCRRLLHSVLRDQGEIDEDSVICALEMFKIVGPFIDKEATGAVEFLDGWLQQLDYSRKFGASSEVQPLITNLLKLRANGWEKEKLRTMSGVKRIIEEENGGIGKIYYGRESEKSEQKIHRKTLGN